jgi:light-harvesting complex I chlorophyll a/b binding protein 1
MFQILTAIAAVEFVSCVAVQQMMSGASDRAPGDFGFDPMNMKGKTAKDMETMQLKEIENGRLAMVAFAGMVTQAALGKGFPYA